MNDSRFNSLIPPQPEVLVEIARLLKAENPDLARIATLIKSDVALYSVVLKSINSPYYGLRVSVTSIEHAISLLGLDQIYNLVRLTILRNTLKKTGRMERFWDTAKDVSQLSLNVAGKLRLQLNKDDVYTLGMLHDCGLPLMVQAFSGFREFLQSSPNFNVTELDKQERESFGFSHYQVGARMAERWNLPQHVADAIRLQPQMDEVLSDKVDTGEKTRHLLAVLALAQDISSEYRYYWRIQPAQQLEQLQPALRFLSTTDYDYLTLKERLIEEMA
ncbi:HDOD domain-containing protein [Marinobacterium sp. MBR-109]|jgi:HD-like signal output (HDOD) protein|uniref:HDOD domain-containing protein n=1 Tax=Marinobacterium sp. MBR-109 TaxID=3156462 RepID=UPI00339415DC